MVGLFFIKKNCSFKFAYAFHKKLSPGFPTWPRVFFHLLSSANDLYGICWNSQTILLFFNNLNPDDLSKLVLWKGQERRSEERELKYGERAVFIETGQGFVKGRSWEEMKIRIAFFLVNSPTSCEELVVVKVGDRNLKTLFV